MAKKKPPPRLYFLMARDAPIGVIFRRGPTDWVQLVHWRTDTDIFTPGQWFHGRVYEKRCDLSPDGTKVVYFAQKITQDSIDDCRGLVEELRRKPVPKTSAHYTYAWTAVSKPPYFTALALWPKGDCWAGGGLFEKNNVLWLNHGPGMDRPHKEHLPTGLKVKPNPECHGEDSPIFYRRLLRDGWQHVRSMDAQLTGHGFATSVEGIWRKPNPKGDGVLWLAESLDVWTMGYDFAVAWPSGATTAVTGARWADWDQAGRLVYANEGKIFAANVGGDTLAVCELIDLNPNTPEEVETPAAFRRW